MSETDPRPDDARTDDGGPNPLTGERDVTDEDLPEDVRPGEDNPLAKPADGDAEAERSLDPHHRDGP